jgi:hypothetical protein
MASNGLAVYLNDHLAGSTTALTMLEHLRTRPGFEAFAGHLHDEIAADRGELEGLMRQASVARSAPRQAIAWFAEQFTRLKTRLDDPSGGALELLELFDLLAVGIHGKRSLWSALQAASADAPSLRTLDYVRLIKRAEEQREQLEARRLDIALLALRSVR